MSNWHHGNPSYNSLGSIPGAPISLPNYGPKPMGECCERNEECKGYCRLNDVTYYRWGQGHNLAPEPVDWLDQGGGLLGCPKGHCSQSKCADPTLGHVNAENDCLYDSAARKRHCCADGQK